MKYLMRVIYFSRLSSILLLLFGSTMVFAGSTNKERPVLKVCADPELMPFSNLKQEGMENKIAALLAQSLGSKLEYEWFPQRMGFIRNTLRAEEHGKYKCDVVLSVPEHFELADTTKPYYAATYVLVYVKNRKLDDIVEANMLWELRDQYPDIKFGLFDHGPAQIWVFKHGLMDSMVPYQFQTGNPKSNPTELILNDLYDGKIDATIVWGPAAAYFSQQNKARGSLAILPLIDDPEIPEMKFVYNMSMAVRHGDSEWRDQLNALITKHQQEINEIISSYGIPIVEVKPKPPVEDD